MVACRLRSIPRRRLSWLLWLGVLFAFAQAAANVHAISHLGRDASRTQDGGLVHEPCDLCLIGASIGGAAPAAEAPSVWLPDVGEAPDAERVRVLVDGAPALAYRSRAPPAAPR